MGRGTVRSEEVGVGRGERGGGGSQRVVTWKSERRRSAHLLLLPLELELHLSSDLKLREKKRGLGFEVTRKKQGLGVERFNNGERKSLLEADIVCFD